MEIVTLNSHKIIFVFIKLSDIIMVQYRYRGHHGGMGVSQKQPNVDGGLGRGADANTEVRKMCDF